MDVTAVRAARRGSRAAGRAPVRGVRRVRVHRREPAGLRTLRPAADPAAPVRLDASLGNTRQIGETFADLAPFRMRLPGGDGPAVRLLECTAAEALSVADDAVDGLLDEWRPK